MDKDEQERWGWAVRVLRQSPTRADGPVARSVAEDQAEVGTLVLRLIPEASWSFGPGQVPWGPCLSGLEGLVAMQGSGPCRMICSHLLGWQMGQVSPQGPQQLHE